MVKDLNKVLMRVANKRYVILDKDPMVDPFITRVNLAKVPEDPDKFMDDVLEFEACFELTADLLRVVTDDELVDYLIKQIDRVFAGLPAQGVRLFRKGG